MYQGFKARLALVKISSCTSNPSAVTVWERHTAGELKKQVESRYYLVIFDANTSIFNILWMYQKFILKVELTNRIIDSN